MTRREPPVTPPEPRCHDCGHGFAHGDVCVLDAYDRPHHVECLPIEGTPV